MIDRLSSIPRILIASPDLGYSYRSIFCVYFVCGWVFVCLFVWVFCFVFTVCKVDETSLVMYFHVQFIGGSVLISYFAFIPTP